MKREREIEMTIFQHLTICKRIEDTKLKSRINCDGNRGLQRSNMAYYEVKGQGYGAKKDLNLINWAYAQHVEGSELIMGIQIGMERNLFSQHRLYKTRNLCFNIFFWSALVWNRNIGIGAIWQ